MFVLLSPVGDYFQGGARALKILIETQHLRSTPDFGMAKTGGNYASALRHVIDARERYGADQVLFCPQGDVQETGASNFFLLNDRELMTKPLNTSYLHGVTRDS
ncbi:MAG: branched chain amino acid aminotransferase, partial [bacterium]|nr:branched chain amino acid aminotransferase [bacterium]